MARPSVPKPAPEPAPPRPVFHAVEALPRLMPAALAEAAAQGWQLLAVVAMRDSNDHVAYFRRAD